MIKQIKPENSIDFTIEMLEKLHRFIESDVVSKLKYFCEYDKVALLDAMIYLNDHKELVDLIDRARNIAYKSAEEDEQELKTEFKMDANGNLTRV